MKNKISSNLIIAIAILGIFTWLIFIPTNFLLSHGYKSYVNVLFEHVTEEWKFVLLESSTGPLFFNVFKVACILIYIWLILIWIDLFRNQNKKITNLLLKIARGLSLWYKGNRNYVSELGNTNASLLFFILGIQFFVSSSHLFTIPLSYDEWWSYRFFSGQGFWTTLSWYPVPNNHVFYNLIAGVSLKLPIDEEIAVRMPSLFASLFTLYYFFKICKCCFSSLFSIILLVIVISIYPFALYSFQARGYSFVNLFSVLLIYSCVKLFDIYINKKIQYEILKYRSLFVLSLFLGLFSVPTFLYTLFPILVVFGLMLLKERSRLGFLSLIKDGCIALILTAFGYLCVFLLNSSENILNPNGGNTKFSLMKPGAFEKMTNHLKDVSLYLVENELLLFIISPFVLFIAIRYFFKTKGIIRFVAVLAAGMYFSPFLILVIHKVIPFERTWTYLVFPIVLSFGFILYGLLRSLSTLLKLNQTSLIKHLALLFVVLGCVFTFAKFNDKHRKENEIDFEFEEFRRADLNKFHSKIKKIGYTEFNYEFYVSDMIYAVCFKNDKKRWIDIDPLDSISRHDILVIEKSELPKYTKLMSTYKFLKQFKGNILVFGRDSLLMNTNL